MSQAASHTGSILVSTEWLAARLLDSRGPGMCVVDVRGEVLPPGNKPRYLPKRAEYDAAHVPGAVFVDWTRDIVDAADPIPVQVAPGPEFAEKMGQLGISDDSLVIVYDDYDHVFAGRLAWALRYYGHEGVRILDGGWSRWIAQGRPVTHDVPQHTGANGPPFTARVRPELRSTADEVARAIGRSDVLLLDARAPEQYAGLASAATRSGHIPGARNVHYACLIEPETKLFLPADGLARVFADSGIDVKSLPPKIIAYCNGGISCTVALNALRILGRDDVAVYDGSWNEWGNDERRPIKVGNEP